MTDVDAELAAGNMAIDQAATDAGRTPSQIRQIFDFSGSFVQTGRASFEGTRRTGSMRCSPSSATTEQAHS